MSQLTVSNVNERSLSGRTVWKGSRGSGIVPCSYFACFLPLAITYWFVAIPRAVRAACNIASKYPLTAWRSVRLLCFIHVDKIFTARVSIPSCILHRFVEYVGVLLTYVDMATALSKKVNAAQSMLNVIFTGFVHPLLFASYRGNGFTLRRSCFLSFTDIHHVTYVTMGVELCTHKS